jgi:hypothetical protein
MFSRAFERVAKSWSRTDGVPPTSYAALGALRAVYADVADFGFDGRLVVHRSSIDRSRSSIEADPL